MKPAKELFKDSWLFFKSHWTTLLVISVGFAIVSYIYNNLLPLFISGILGHIIQNVHVSGLAILFNTIAGILFFAFVIGSIALSCIQNMIIPLATNELLENKPFAFKDSIKRLIRMTPAYFWMIILMSLIMFGGLILFIIPGVYFALVLRFAAIALIVDGKRGFAAIAHSQALFKGRFWKVIGKTAYPILYSLGLFALAAIIIIPILIFIESWWVKVPLLIAITIPTFVGFFILFNTSIIYTIKLYRELSDTIIGDITQIPRRLKVWSWIGVACILIILSLGAMFIVKNPSVIAAIKKEMNAIKNAPAYRSDLGSGNLTKSHTYSGFGLTFDYPGRLLDMGPNDVNGSLAVLTDTTSPSVESGYMPQVSILGFEPKEEVKDLSALDLLKRNFVPDFEAGKKTGEVIEYTVEKTVLNGYEFAVLTSKELVEGQSVVTQTTLYKDKDVIYLFQGIALESEKDSLKQALDQIFGTIKIGDTSEAEE